MTTKKSKPASLTSSLLARKGEAEPAAAPYSIPESGRQRPAESMAGKGNGNGNGGDLGHALSGMTRLPSSTPDPKPILSENGAQPATASPAERPLPRMVPSPAQPPTSTHAPVQASTVSPVVGPVPAAAEEPVDKIATAPAKEAAGAEAVAEASAAPGERPAARPKPVAANAAPPKRDGDGDGGGGAGSDGGEAEQEAARDARLLRFVYVMAALTGIVAIVLYAGGWLREGPKQRAPEESVASAPAQSTEPAVGTDATNAAPVPDVSGAPIPETSGGTQSIPPAPPVAPPSSAETKPNAPDTPLTTGGPAKLQPEALPSMPSGTEVGQGAATGAPGLPPSAAPTIPIPSGAQSGSTTAKGPSAPAGGNAGSAPSAPAARASASPKTVVPDESAAGKAVRDVPNLRVLAPALVKPEPAESAPPPITSIVPEPGSVPVLAVPKPAQTASVPKVAPVKRPAAAASGGFLVQLASVTSEKLAEREWGRLQKIFPDVLGGRKLTVEKKEIAGRGTFYRVQTGGYSTLDEARAVCNGLKEKKQACLPVNR